MGGKRRFKVEAGKKDEKEKDKHSSLISVLPILAGKKAPLNPDEQFTKDDTERNNVEGIDESMI